MNEQIKVSVIIPVYNVENYISECLDSVRCQTLKEIEILCVNDGTEDRSFEIVRAAAEEDRRIVLLVHDRNRGLSAARNTGLANAHGEYVYFLDSDDYIEADALENLYKRMEAETLDACAFSSRLIFESEELRKRFGGNPAVFKGDYPDVLSGKELFEKWMEVWDWIPLQQRFFYRRRFLAKNGLSFREGMLHEDELFTFRMLMCAERVRAFRDKWFVRRYRQESIMSGTVTFRNVEGCVIILSELAGARMRFEKDPALCSAVCFLAGKLTADVRKKCLAAGNINETEDHKTYNHKNRNHKKNDGDRFLITGTDPFLSVIIPVYNTAPYLAMCLDSVLSQSFVDFEVICADDGSTDGSGEILADHENLDPRVRVLSSPVNRGQAAARNLALSEARGEYVYMLDSDDWIVPDMFASLREKILAYDLPARPDVIGFENRQFADAPEFEEQAAEVLFTYEKTEGNYTGKEAFIRCMKEEVLSPSVPTFWIRRAFLEENRLRFAEGMPHEDIGFILEMFLRAEKVLLLHKAFFCRRFRAHSTVTKGFDAVHAEGYLNSWRKAFELEREGLFQTKRGKAEPDTGESLETEERIFGFDTACRKWLRNTLGRIRVLACSEGADLSKDEGIGDDSVGDNSTPNDGDRDPEIVPLLEMLRLTAPDRRLAEEILGKELCGKLESEAKVCLCGTGQYTRMMIGLCGALDVVIAGVIEEKEKIRGRNGFCGFPILSPEEAAEQKIPAVVSVSHYQEKKWAGLLEKAGVTKVIRIEF